MSGTDKPAAAGSEPSMDDILASIRKILNDDGTPGDQPPLPAPPPPPSEPLMLTEAMLVPPPVPAEPEPAAPEPPLMPLSLGEALAPAPSPPPPPEPAAMTSSELLAPAAAAATAASMGELLRAVSQDRAAPIANSAGVTIEDVVREMLRPLLKDWLDTHLPAIVERTVRQEIERVVASQR
jgi:cell pole-organizing protein PopZ